MAAASGVCARYERSLEQLERTTQVVTNTERAYLRCAGRGMRVAVAYVRRFSVRWTSPPSPPGHHERHRE